MPRMLGWGIVLALGVLTAPPHAQAAQPPAGASSRQEARRLLARATELAETAGRQGDALPLLDRALALAVRGGDLEAQSEIELQRAHAHRGLAQPGRARAAAERARALAARPDHPALAVRALSLLAMLAGEAGDFRAAQERLREAEPLAARVADRKVLAALAEALGRNARDLGQNEESLRYHARAIAIAGEAGDHLVEIRSLTVRSATYLGLGRFAEALADAQRAFELARDQEPRMRPAAAFGLAQAHAYVWNLDRAATLWTEAIEAYRELGPPLGVALALRQRMDTWYAMGELARAAEDGAQALALFAKTGSAGAQPGLLARLALIASRRGHAEAATAYARQARQSAGTGPERRFLDNDLGLVSWRLGDLDAAGRSFDDVFVRSRALGDPEYEWRARYGLGRVALARGRPDEARSHLAGAVEVVERMRRELPEAGLRASFLSDRNMAYEALVTALIAGGGSPGGEPARQALAVAERARSRSLADLLAESQQRLADPRLETVRAEERRFSARLSALQRRILAASDPAVRDPLVAELREAEAEYEDLVVRVRRENPAYAGLAYPEPLSPDGLEALPAADEALVEFLFDEDRGYAWIVRRGRIESYPIPGAATLEHQIRLLGALAAAGDTAGTEELGRRLYDVLLGPARARLAGARRLVVVPAGPLHRLAFALLRTPGGGWLFEEQALSLAPSATVLAEMRRRQPAAQARTLLAFAAPVGSAPTRSAVFAPGDLPATGLLHADAEVRDVARLLGAEAVRRDGPRRLEAEIKAASGAYRVLHFATHAVIDEVVPRRSAILLGASGEEDGLLQMNEIPNLALQAELVVLAACRSHVGRALGGEGLRGLSRAFMRAGSRAVIATLWEVDDAQTRRLMQTFYRGLRDGLPPDRALETAQRAMIRAGGAAASPRVWAAFVVTGDASRVLFERQSTAWGWLATGGMLIGGAAAGAAWALRRRARRR